MAQKADKTTVRRITASDDRPKQTTPKTKKLVNAQTPANKQVTSDDTATKNPLKALGGYFKGAWHELKQVRWPNRANTWSMTGAVLLFTLMFVILIILLDAGFNWTFEKLLK